MTVQTKAHFRRGPDLSAKCQEQELRDLLIPYFFPGVDHIREYRLRRDHPDFEYDSSGNLKPRQKYLSPPGRSNVLYLAPGVGDLLFRDPSVPTLIIEGKFKALALWRLANYLGPSQPRFVRGGFGGLLRSRSAGDLPHAILPASHG